MVTKAGGVGTQVQTGAPRLNLGTPLRVDGRATKKTSNLFVRLVLLSCRACSRRRAEYKRLAFERGGRVHAHRFSASLEQDVWTGRRVTVFSR